jgi:2-dehydro-3-deoxyphosphooctonate aldolase (KDO 8-P synthase)
MVPDLFFENLKIGNQLMFILGPCVIENGTITFDIARHLKKLSEELKFPFIFKASFDKANRTSLDSFRGPGLIKGLDILSRINEELRLPVTTDIHEPRQAEEVGKVVSLLQIPAFLCRQTDLLVAAGETGIPVNIKKGQFLSAESMKFAVEKVSSTGNKRVMVTERGNSFGYHDLVVDLKNIAKLKALKVPVIIDATHAVQQPPAGQKSSGGNRAYVPVIAAGAVAAGADGVFLEVHPKPEKALSDGQNSLPLDQLANLIPRLQSVYGASS